MLIDNIQIKKAETEEDFKTLAEFLYLLFCDMYTNQDWSYRKDSYIEEVSKYYRDNANSPNQLNFIAFDGDKAVGSACAVLHDRPPYIKHTGTRYGYVHNVFVLEEYRGKGIARELMNTLHKEALAAGVVRLGLHTSLSAKPLYLGMGYGLVEKYLETKDLW